MPEHVECLAFARLRRRARRDEIVAAHARLGDARVGQRHGACRLLHRLLRARARLGLGDAGDLAVGRFGERAHLLRRHVAGNDENGVVGRVEAPVEGERLLAIELLDLVPPADHRPAVGMVEVERGVHLLAQPRAGIVGDPHVLLFQHHLELRPHRLVGQHQSGHAVGLELHHGCELVARHALEIAGVVGGGEGVLLAADGRHHLGEAPGWILLRALEQQVLEEVGEPRLARRLVGGADLVPEHVGHDRRAVIGNHHDLETVRQLEIGDAGAARRRRSGEGEGVGSDGERDELVQGLGQ